jgi:predicted PurR-regulated permease PerM
MYVSALFAVVLMPLVDRITLIGFRGRRLSRLVAIILLVVSVFIALTLLFVLGLPPVIRDIHQFALDLPERIPPIVAHLKKIPLADKFGVDALAQRAEDAASSVASYLFASFPLWMSRIFDLLTAFILCIYFMLEGEFAYRWFLSLFDMEPRIRLHSTLAKAETRMSKWLVGQGSLMLILGLSSIAVFGLLKVRYFVLLGCLMGLMNIVPIAGGVVTILLVAGIAALDSWTKMALVFAFYAIYINLENAVLTPRIMGNTVDLMGLTVLIALLLGTAVAGIVGALVAIPTAVLVTCLIHEYFVVQQ